MNERIRQIALNSGIDIRGHLTGQLELDQKPKPYDIEVFAKLIVKECMDLVATGGNSKAEALNAMEELIWSR